MLHRERQRSSLRRRFETAIKQYPGTEDASIRARFCCTNWRLTALKGPSYLTNSSALLLLPPPPPIIWHLYACVEFVGSLEPRSTDSLPVLCALPCLPPLITRASVGALSTSPRVSTVVLQARPDFDTLPITRV